VMNFLLQQERERERVDDAGTCTSRVEKLLCHLIPSCRDKRERAIRSFQWAVRTRTDSKLRLPPAENRIRRVSRHSTIPHHHTQGSLTTGTVSFPYLLAAGISQRFRVRKQGIIVGSIRS
jgi:hypothetical protein